MRDSRLAPGLALPYNAAVPPSKVRHFRRGWRSFKRQLADPVLWPEEHLVALIEEFLSAIENGAFDDKRSTGRRFDVVAAVAYQLMLVERIVPYLSPHVTAVTGFNNIDAIRCYFAQKDKRDRRPMGYSLQWNANRGRRILRTWLLTSDDLDLRRFHGPAWLWGAKGVGIAVLAAAIAIAAINFMFVEDQHSNRDASPFRIIGVELEDGPRLVFLWPDGRWALARPGGVIEFRADDAATRLPPSNQNAYLPGVVDVIAGDVTGDEGFELAFLAGNPFDGFVESVWRMIAQGRRRYRPPPSGVWLFQRTSAYQWSHVASIPSYLPSPGPVAEYCEDVVVDHWQAQELARETGMPALAIHREKQIPGYGVLSWRLDDLAEARRHCPSLVNGVELKRGSVTLFLGSYGRMVIQAQCDEYGCEPTTEVMRFDSNLEDVVTIRAGHDTRVRLLSTGCWREDGTDAYSVWLSEHGPVPRLQRIATFAGRPLLERIDDEQVAIAIASACGGPSELPLISGSVTDGNAIQNQVLLARVSAKGYLNIEHTIEIAKERFHRMTVIRDRSDKPLALVIASYDPTDILDVRLHDLANPSRFVIVGDFASDCSPHLNAVDVDGDGADELVVGAYNGAGMRVFRVTRSAESIHVEQSVLPWDDSEWDGFGCDL